MDNWKINCPGCKAEISFDPADRTSQYNEVLDDVTDGRVDHACEYCGEEFQVVAHHTVTLSTEPQ